MVDLLGKAIGGLGGGALNSLTNGIGPISSSMFFLRSEYVLLNVIQHQLTGWLMAPSTLLSTTLGGLSFKNLAKLKLNSAEF